MLGATTIAGVIVGALSNANVLNVNSTMSQARFPVWLLVIGGVALLLVVVPAICALLPREWQFSPDPVALYANVESHMGDATDDDAVLSWVKGFVTPAPGETKTPLDENDSKLEALKWFVVVETIGLACVIGFAFANIIYLSVVG